MKKSKVLFYMFSGTIYRVIRKVVGILNFKRKRYGTRKILNQEQTNDEIYKKLINSDHFFIGRLGDVECRLLETMIKQEVGLISSIPSKIQSTSKTSAGIFFSTQEEIEEIREIYKKSLSSLTHICVWFNYLEDLLCDEFASNAKLCSLMGLDSYLFNVPWTSGLKDKKVLVVSPFADSILYQYNNYREKLFSNPLTLPRFSKLLVYKPEMTFASCNPKFESWNKTLDYMFENIKDLDFDVAILGCGGYGLPLGSKLYNIGKSVIHAGGVTQIYFGVKGKRWENLPYAARVMNQYWKRPNEEEIPAGQEKVEGGCYW